MAELQLFGPVELWASGRPVDLGSIKQRTVLAALLVDLGRPVSTETLIDRVWDDNPPAGARSTLYSYVTGLRRALTEATKADGTSACLVRRSGGYLLGIDPDSVDLHRFRRLLDRVQVEGQPEARVALLRKAIEQWKGEPLGNLRGEWVGRVRTGWQRQYFDTLIRWAQAEFASGNARTILGRLTELNVEYPLVEPLVAVLMRALYATGRTTEAIACYARTRHLLADQLGLDPGPELEEVHQTILRGDADHRFDVKPTVTPSRSAVPAQLPLDLSSFSGRDDELRQLDA